MRVGQQLVDLAGDVPFQTADDLFSGFAFRLGFPQIVEGWLGCLVGFFVVDRAGHVEGGVESVVVVPAVDPVGDVLSGLGFGLVFAV